MLHLLPIGDRLPYVSIANLEEEPISLADVVVTGDQDVPKGIDFTPNSLFPYSVPNLNEVLAQLRLNDSSKIPAYLNETR